MKHLLMVPLLAAASAGCTTTPATRPVPADHPASAHAVSSAIPEPSRTLSNPDPVFVAPSATPAPATQPGAAQQQALYACPMHPEVTSSEPSRCPKCGMKLVKSEQGGHRGH